MSLNADHWRRNDRLQRASEKIPPEPIRVGESDRDAVVLLQQALIMAGFPIPSGATGNYREETAAAVRAVQQRPPAPALDAAPRPPLGRDVGIAGHEVLTALDEKLQADESPPSADSSVIQDLPTYIDNAAFSVGMEPVGPNYIVYYSIAHVTNRITLAPPDLERSPVGVPGFVQRVFQHNSNEFLQALANARHSHRDEQGIPLGTLYGFYELSTRAIVPTKFSPISTPRILAGIQAKDAANRQNAAQIRDLLISQLLIPMAISGGIRAVFRGFNYFVSRGGRVTRAPAAPVSRQQSRPPETTNPSIAVTDAASAARARSDLRFAEQAARSPNTIYQHQVRSGGLRDIASTDSLEAGLGSSSFGGGSGVRAHFGPASSRVQLPVIEFTTPVPGSVRHFQEGIGVQWHAEGFGPAIPSGRLSISIRRIVYPDGTLAFPAGAGRFRLKAPDGSERIVLAADLPIN